ncbi:L-threonine 3-dehydrogenase [Nakamurella lactea]|uniref:L-threonine 3-dehydrogenase n=1 Tax=Nakamurella lactea TaxID=459515 RepID=UPI00048E2ED8|nr:L-threonine 3-dehydrogenase [Nakamurella lactea]
MRALFKATAAPGFEMTERPEPEAGPGEVKIRVLRTGICGTDLHIHRWDGWAQGAIHPPLIPGHEFCGEVVDLGEGVQDVRLGDFVSGEGHIVCGTCRNCRAGRRHLCIRTSSIGVDRDGAFAEFVVIPETNVWVHKKRLDDASGVDLDIGAIFDPFGNAVHTALSFPLVGEDVLITGAGPIGLMAAAVARKVGARFVVITDVSEPRLALARQLGVDLAVNVADTQVSQAQAELGMVEGFDVAMEMSGNPAALPEIIANLNHGGRIAMLGLPSQPIQIDWAKVVSHMITIRGIYGREMFETWYAMSSLLRSGLDISPVITDRFPASQWQAGFDAAAHGTGGKVVLDWTV